MPGILEGSGDWEQGILGAQMSGFCGRAGWAVGKSRGGLGAWMPEFSGKLGMGG